MMNVVFHHDPVEDHLEWSPCQYFGKNVGIGFLCIHMYRGHYLPVAESSHPFLAAVDVFEFGFVGGTIEGRKS